jgi:UDP-N-acetylglucosamine:LPS N-acetylglucosamine transferase
MSQTLRILMAGGGTGGHVIPLLAVAEELRARGHEPYFVGTERGAEVRLVPGGLQGVSFARRASAVTSLLSRFIALPGFIALLSRDREGAGFVR